MEVVLSTWSDCGEQSPLWVVGYFWGLLSCRSAWPGFRPVLSSVCLCARASGWAPLHQPQVALKGNSGGGGAGLAVSEGSLAVGGQPSRKPSAGQRLLLTL